jgi:hypothetical protein
MIANVLLDLLSGELMIATRDGPLGDITCPAPGCQFSGDDIRKMDKHFKAAHTLPATIGNVEIKATPAERQAASIAERTRNQRYQPYAPPPARPKEVEGQDAAQPGEPMDVVLDREAEVEDPVEAITSQISRITPFCKCH